MNDVPGVLKGKTRFFAPLAAAAGLLLYACGSAPPPQKAPPPPPAPPPVAAPVQAPSPPPPPRVEELVRTVPAIKPVWMGESLDGGAEKFFVGKSPQKSPSEGEAEAAAREDARAQILYYYGTLLQARAFERPIAGITELLNREADIQGYLQTALSSSDGDGRFMEVYRNERNQESFVVYFLFRVPEEEAGEHAARFAANISRLYAGSLKPPGTLSEALVMYDTALAALGQNRLHRAIAYYQGPGGEKTGLSQYLAGELTALVKGLAFEPLSPPPIQKTDLLAASLRVSSAAIETIGSIDARIDVYAEKGAAALASFRLPAGADNRFSLQVPTQKFPPGRYRVAAELLLKEVSNQAMLINQNTLGGFSFEVTQVNAVLVFAGERLTGEEKAALTGRIGEALEENALPVRLVPEHGGEQNRYSILITVNSGVLPPIPPVSTWETVFWDLSLAFLNNGKTLQQTERARFSEPRTDFNKAFPQAASHIKKSGPFFAGVNASVTE